MPEKTQLTSVAIPASEQGSYSWDQRTLLIPHEAVRREILRGSHALSRMDPVGHPWQSYGWYTWIEGFLWPSIHDHHDNEEDILGPHYKKLGFEPVFGERSTHKDLLAMMDGISKDSKALVEATVSVEKVGAQGQKAVTAAFAVLKASWSTFQASMETHLAEEERVWPPIFLKVGEPEFEKFSKKMLNAPRSKEDQAAFQAFFGAVANAMGVSFAYPKGDGPSTPSHALDLAPWCSKEGAAAFFAPMPWIPKALVFPSFERAYLHKWKALVDSLSGPDNTLGVTPKGLPSQAACCTVM